MENIRRDKNSGVRVIGVFGCLFGCQRVVERRRRFGGDEKESEGG